MKPGFIAGLLLGLLTLAWVVMPGGCLSRVSQSGGGSKMSIERPVLNTETGAPVLNPATGAPVMERFESQSQVPDTKFRGQKLEGELPSPPALPAPAGTWFGPVNKATVFKAITKAQPWLALIGGLLFFGAGVFVAFIMKPPQLRGGLVCMVIGAFLCCLYAIPEFIGLGIIVAVAGGAFYLWSERQAKAGSELGRAVTETIDTLPMEISGPFWERFVKVAGPKDKAYLLALAKSDDQLKLV